MKDLLEIFYYSNILHFDRIVHEHTVNVREYTVNLWQNIGDISILLWYNKDINSTFKKEKCLMKFPNAAKGVKRIFVAEVLTLIGLLSVLVATTLILTISSVFTLESAIGAFLAIGITVICLASVVLLIVAFIMELVGVINASRDESSFKSALIFFIVSIVLSIVSSLLKSVSVIAGGILSLIGGLVSIFVLIFIIAGIIRLADRLNRGDVSGKGSKVLKLLIIIKVVALIVTTIASFMGDSASISAVISSMVAPSEVASTPSTAVVIILIATPVLEVIQYIIYLPFLSQAKKMLNKA